ncbi:MAG: GlxA family transcriptional regulator [Halofilum sp. (in: g-proteobacteria)]|nr:GlxA family transcriptional regulator [Halofilum sp. (in: g-proteobacteria)]
MLQPPEPGTTQRIGFLLLPKFSLMSLLATIEPLRGANRTLEYQAYSWHFLSADGAPVAASNGIPIAPEAGIDDADDFPAVCVLASYDPLATVDNRLCRWLRRLHRQGAQLGGFETGTLILAEAGLLGGRRVTLHWETLEAFRETYLDVDARESLYEIDGSIFTCSGATAPMDFMLSLIGQHHSAAVAAAVADQFVHTEIRGSAVRQRMPADRRVGVSDPELVRVIETMEANLEQPLSLGQLAERCGLSRRRLQRLFDRHMDEPPQRHYLRLRLERAQHLLRHGDLPVHEVAIACGFGSAAYFARAYRAHHGHPPTAECSQ